MGSSDFMKIYIVGGSRFMQGQSKHKKAGDGTKNPINRILR